MVDVNPVNKSTSVSVSSSGTVSQIKTTTPQNYYDGLSKQWAISEDKVQGLDYSSKYYAQKAQENSQGALNALENVENVTTNAIDQITTTKNETVNNIYNISSQTQQEITELEETLKADLEATKTNAIDEVVENKANAIDEIETTVEEGTQELNKIKEEAANLLEDASDIVVSRLAIDVSNATSETKENIISWSLPDYSAITTYTFGTAVPSDGYVCAQVKVAAGATATITIDGVNAFPFGSRGTNPWTHSPLFPVCKGQVVDCNNTQGIDSSYFMPLKGAN